MTDEMLIVLKKALGETIYMSYLLLFWELSWEYSW